ncbi:MAG: hypothetical protein A3F68_10525 [Acidobacteria bacterium RIFCSPLOWO2_12_FULL_54_10]|nr:MAG: hypothetical protein A3F68_10525 [Acidobacteria bacterium RIFCSPLOWO2_12_FULL_54_10]
MLPDTDLIRKLEFFEPLDGKIIQKIAKQCIARQFSEGDYIVRQGESGLGLYFITQGRAKVEIERNGVRAAITELQEGDFLGELSIIDDKARSANVICMEDTRCLLLTRDSFSKLVNKHPQIAIQMVKVLVGRIRSSNEKIATRPAEQPSAAPPPPQAEASAEAQPQNESSSGLPFQLPISGGDVIKIYSDTKSQAKEFMVDIFKNLYLAKAMTKYSLSIVGCPVTVRPLTEGSGVHSVTIEGVKLTLYPAEMHQTIHIEAFDSGHLSATVFRPIRSRKNPRVSITRYEKAIDRNDQLHLEIPLQSPIRLLKRGDRIRSQARSVEEIAIPSLSKESSSRGI